uniref:(northern house mosquito) hypothetical protein n=1 Tax=Culex pipiens TaxID=7175 RepID=A0A8D8HKH9_CULPI
MIVATASRSPISLGRSLRPSRCRGLRGTTRCPSSYRELLEMSRLWRLRGRWPVPGLPLPDTSPASVRSRSAVPAPRRSSPSTRCSTCRKRPAPRTANPSGTPTRTVSRRTGALTSPLPTRTVTVR